MATFQEAFPELTAQAPHVHGNPMPSRSKLTQLSRQQLRDLARAYEIEVPKDGTKDQMLPAMINAEQSGIFRGPVKSEYHLMKAARDRDSSRGIPMTLPDPDLIEDTGLYRPASEMGDKQIRAILKDAGINTFGMGRKQMEELVESGGKQERPDSQG